MVILLIFSLKKTINAFLQSLQIVINFSNLNHKYQISTYFRICGHAEKRSSVEEQGG